MKSPFILAAAALLLGLSASANILVNGEVTENNKGHFLHGKIIRNLTLRH